jgi:hypothetical protein
MGRAKFRRPASDEERDFIDWLLRHAATTSAEHFLTQVPNLQVVGVCGCGCPSVDFQVGGQDANAFIIADAYGTSPEGVPVGVLLWGKQDRISGLEVYPVTDDQNFQLPRLDTLSPTSGSGAG